jgi:hypothetical protein
VGTQAFWIRFHWRTHRYRDLLQPYFYLLHRLWFFPCPTDRVGPHFFQGIYKDSSNSETRAGWCLSSRVRVVVLGTGWLCAIILSRSQHSTLTFVFSGCQFVRPRRLGHSVRPSRFRFDHLPGALRSEHCRCRSCWKLVGAI